MNRPILKWAGGKTRVMPDLLPHLPGGDLLIEPFAGSGTVFMNTNYKRYILADINADLIDMFINAAFNTQDFIRLTRRLFLIYRTKELYLKCRDEFNQSKGAGTVERSAQFLYLNRHCFNGLCRYNLTGAFNTPYGNYKATYFPLQEILKFAQKVRDTNTQFICADFSATIEQYSEKNATIYCDPPYLPESQTANFSQYHSSTFSIPEHHHLVAALQTANRRHGVKVVISGSDTDETRRIYQGFDLQSVSVHRSVSATAATRGAAAEVIGTYRELQAGL